MPSCIHTTLAPAAIASSTTAGTAEISRKISTISTGGGTRPAWARNGRELFYLDASNTLIAVPVHTSGSTFSAGNQAKVFDGKYAEPFPARHYDVSADGQRFLIGTQLGAPTLVTIILNWDAALK